MSEPVSDSANLDARPVRLVVLGSGTGRPTARRGSPGYLLELPAAACAVPEWILLDPGPGSVRAAAQAGYPLESVAGVLLTHFHPDHCLDLFALLFALRNPALEERSIHVLGPRGLGRLLERGVQLFGDWVRLPPERCTVVELEPGPFAVEVAGASLEGAALSLPHLPHSLGYRLHTAHGLLAWSGDTGEGEAVVELGRMADWFLLEAAYPDGSDTRYHLTPEVAGRIARDAGCAHLWITHLYPETEATDVQGALRRHYQGPLTLVEDGQVFEL